MFERGKNYAIHWWNVWIKWTVSINLLLQGKLRGITRLRQSLATVFITWSVKKKHDGYKIIILKCMQQRFGIFKGFRFLLEQRSKINIVKSVIYFPLIISNVLRAFIFSTIMSVIMLLKIYTSKFPVWFKVTIIFVT